MKTTTLRLLFVTIISAISFNLVAQDLVGSAIKVKGSRYSDKVWVFEVDNTTRGYDWGWDAYKIQTASALPPSIYASEPKDIFQIDVVPAFQDTYLSFRSGEDTVYTITFTNQLIETKHTQFFLYDSVANKTVDALAVGASYRFSVKPATLYAKRFKLLTALPVIVPVVDSTKTDTVVVPTTKTIPTATNENDTTPIPTTPETSKSVTTATASVSETAINAYYHANTVFVNNKSADKGILTIYEIGSGKQVASESFGANSVTTFKMALKGIYLVKLSAGDKVQTGKMIME